MNLYQPIEDCVRLVVEFAEAHGVLTVPQYWATKPVSLDDGSEFALSMGPMRYTLRLAIQDAEESPGSVSVVFGVRMASPDDPEGMEAYADHKRRQIEEQGAA